MSQSSKPSRKRKLPSPEASPKRFCCGFVDPRSTDPDVLIYQAPYMKVRLKEYRRQVQSLETQLEDSDKQKIGMVCGGVIKKGVYVWTASSGRGAREGGRG